MGGRLGNSATQAASLELESEGGELGRNESDFGSFHAGTIEGLSCPKWLISSFAGDLTDKHIEITFFLSASILPAGTPLPLPLAPPLFCC